MAMVGELSSTTEKEATLIKRLNSRIERVVSRQMRAKDAFKEVAMRLDGSTMPPREEKKELVEHPGDLGELDSLIRSLEGLTDELDEYVTLLVRL